MLYDVKEKQQDMKDVLTKMQEKIEKNEIESMMIMWKPKEDKVISRYFYQGSDSILEWIGAIEVAKGDLVDAVLYD